jgi:Fe-S cluster biogenesis protein NfuA
MNIEFQTTPDENTMNFFPDQPIVGQTSASYTNRKSIRKSPLAEKIFDIGGISSIFITSDMISVTKEPTTEWNEIQPFIMAEIMDYLSIEEVCDNQTPMNDTEQNIIETIKALINSRIRPAIKKDGGDVRFVDYNEGIVTVELQGTCKGCPYALRTLKEGIEKILKTHIPQIKEVRNFEGKNG